MGRPTQRRHSSSRIRIPTAPITTWIGSIRVASLMSVMALKAKYRKQPVPTSISTISYQGMKLTFTWPFLMG